MVTKSIRKNQKPNAKGTKGTRLTNSAQIAKRKTRQFRDQQTLTTRRMHLIERNMLDWTLECEVSAVEVHYNDVIITLSSCIDGTFGGFQTTGVIDSKGVINISADLLLQHMETLEYRVSLDSSADSGEFVSFREFVCSAHLHGQQLESEQLVDVYIYVIMQGPSLAKSMYKFHIE